MTLVKTQTSSVEADGGKARGIKYGGDDAGFTSEASSKSAKETRQRRVGYVR